MPNIRIPMAVCAAVGEVLEGSHATLDALFEAAGVPGPPPDLAHHSKWKTWLFRAGNDPNADSLTILGQLIEEFMDLPPVKNSLASANWQSARDRLNDVLTDHGFQYSQGGRVTFAGKTDPSTLDLLDTNFWVPGQFRLFLSHLSSVKETTAYLQSALYRFGISAFVAHEDIEPTREWQLEIEKALFTMDALAAILTPGFQDSDWTDQEVGIAIGRKVLVIPIRKGLDPYGFVGRYQGIQGHGKTIGGVAKSVFNAITRNPRTKERILDILVEQCLRANDPEEAGQKLSLIRTVEDLPTKHLEKLRRDTSESWVFEDANEITNELNDLLAQYGLTPIAAGEPSDQKIAHDIPF